MSAMSACRLQSCLHGLAGFWQYPLLPMVLLGLSNGLNSINPSLHLPEFTTKWPAGLKTDADVEKHYPVEIVKHSFVNSAPSIRDRRARRVSLRVPLSGLGLSQRSQLKLLRLAKSYGFERGMAQFYSDTDVLELTADRCPVSRQNHEYLVYVFTVLTMESKVGSFFHFFSSSAELMFRPSFAVTTHCLLYKDILILTSSLTIRVLIRPSQALQDSTCDNEREHTPLMILLPKILSLVGCNKRHNFRFS